ncbi:DUF6053 domain-containing protein [Lysobacter enzymogenes]
MGPERPPTQATVGGPSGPTPLFQFAALQPRARPRGRA